MSLMLKLEARERKVIRRDEPLEACSKKLAASKGLVAQVVRALH